MDEIAKAPLYYTDIAEKFAAFDFPHHCAGHRPSAHATEKLWQGPARADVRAGSEFAARPPGK